MYALATVRSQNERTVDDLKVETKYSVFLNEIEQRFGVLLNDNHTDAKVLISNIDDENAAPDETEYPENEAEDKEKDRKKHKIEELIMVILPTVAGALIVLVICLMIGYASKYQRRAVSPAHGHRIDSQSNATENTQLVARRESDDAPAIVSNAGNEDDEKRSDETEIDDHRSIAGVGAVLIL